MAVDVVIRIGETSKLTPDLLGSLEDLIYQLRDQGIDAEIAYRPPSGRGLSWWETIGIYLAAQTIDAATGEVISSSIKSVVSVAKRWAQGHRQQTTRPQVVTLYGPDGRPLKKIEVDPNDQTTETDL